MHSLNFGTHAITAGSWDAIYARYMKEILTRGDTFVGRNGETKSLFGCSVTVDLQHGFPLTRLRKMPIKNLFREFLFDIGFDQNVSALGPAKHFWDFLADDAGNLGASAYNRQWRMWPPSAPGSNVANENLANTTVDQLRSVVEKLRESSGTRHGTVITSNPTAINPGCPPCHLAMQFMPRPNGTLDMMVPARSNDMLVGFPLDIARYAIMTHVIGIATGLKPGRVMMPSSNSHIYENCYDSARRVINREARPECQLVVAGGWEGDIDQLQLEHFSVTSYDPHEAIKVEVN
jgi:thymidylate synthase